MIIAKYKDIKELFNFQILDDRLVIEEQNNGYEQYIYEINPISILDYSDEVYFNVLNCYIEFLKGIECKFKISIRNHKFNVEDYIKDNMLNVDDNIKKLDFYKEYVDSLKAMIKDEKIYYSTIYLCVLCDKKDINIIEENIKKLNSIGVGVNRLLSKDIKCLLYDSINKV